MRILVLVAIAGLASLVTLLSLIARHDGAFARPVRIYHTAGVWVSTLHARLDLTNENLIHDLRLAEAEESS